MSDLTPRDRELVALGAAMGSNCIPCVEYHIAESRRLGLADVDIHAAIQHADKIRQAPARRTLQAAMKLLSPAAGEDRNTGTPEGCGCGASAEATPDDTRPLTPSRDSMMRMMTKMMAACGSHGPEARESNCTETKPADAAAASQGRGPE